MNNDLKIIKKKYGENMSKLCRKLFSSLLQADGLLSSLLIQNFEQSHLLYNDIVNNNLESSFKDYIYNLISCKQEKLFSTDKTPKQLLSEVGYNLYECRTEEEIQQFKKYYYPGEELCTFKGERLKSCRVFFAVKKDVEQIVREDFQNPQRQDLYGTSVISIQFMKGESNTLSIKNRYNHRVSDPDSTFSNNLDNIVPGLTESFERIYNLVQKYRNFNFEIPGYVRAGDGKFYKYNYEINNIYYCPNNIIIDKFPVKRLEKELYILMDYFILDLKNKKIFLYDKNVKDSFIESIINIKKISIVTNTDNKEVTIITEENDEIVITLDSANRIIKLKNNMKKEVGDKYLYLNKYLKELEMLNLQKIGNLFMMKNNSLQKVEMLNLEMTGKAFLGSNNSLKELILPKLRIIGEKSLYFNNSLIKFYSPNLEIVGNNFLQHNDLLDKSNLKRR